MKNTRLVQLLQTFTATEWTSCTKYLRWQYKSDAVELLLFEYLKGCKKKWNSKKLDFTEVKKNVAPNLIDKDFLSRRSKLKLKIESFLLFEIQKEEEHKFDQKLLLGELYKRRGLYNAYKDLQVGLKKEAEKLKIYDLTTYYKKMQWAHQQYFSELSSKDRKINFLKDAYRDLNKFYETLNLFYETEAENLYSLFNQIIILDDYKTQNELKILLQELEKLVSERKLNSFEFLKKELFEKYHLYSLELQQVILLRLINACNAFIKRKQFAYKEDMVELFDFGLATGISLNNGKLSESRFFNMVEAKAKSNNAPESPDFIKDLLDLTQTEYYSTLQKVAYALWYFAKNNYEKALELINNEDIKLKDMNIKLRVRITKICCLSSINPPHKNFPIELNSARVFFQNSYKKGEIGKGSLEAIKNLIAILDMIWHNINPREIWNYKEDCDFIYNEYWIEKKIKKMAQKN